MAKNEVYRVKQGYLRGDNIELPIVFGLVFEEDGLYTIEVYVPESVNLRAFSEGPDAHIDDEFVASFITEDKNELEIRGLYLSNIAFEPRRVSFTCRDCLVHKEISPIQDEPPNIHAAELFYLELEGLKIEFSDITSKFEHRISYDQKSNGVAADHTGAGLLVNQILYSQIFRKSYKNDNIVVEFHNKPNNKLLYNNFLQFKKDYVSLLCLFNGAEVAVRKEFAGEGPILGTGDIYAPIVIIHSFEAIRNESHNKYLILNHRIQNRNPNVLNEAMTQCFNNFIEWNKKIDLSATIFYLNGVEKMRSVEEKFFVQIIAFERLTSLYAEQTGYVDERLPIEQTFEPIKQELFGVVEKHKVSFGANYEKARSIIGNLNEVKRLATTDKMYGILNDTNITVDDDMRELINTVRHKAVHKGYVGEGQRGIINLYLLNEVLHEIIVRLIKYNGPRKSRILLEKKLF